jgi:sec-independent protein translocase protein TatB
VEVLGIGPLELMFVILIALIVIGPKDMSKTARSAGRYLNRMYRSETWRTLTEASRTLQTLPNRLAREAQLEELEALRKDLDDSGPPAKPGVADNPALQPWVTPPTTPEPIKTIAPPQPAEPPTAKGNAVKATSTQKAAPAKPSKAAAKPPVSKAKKTKSTKPSSTTKSGAAKPSKAAAKPPSTAKKSRSSSSKVQGGHGNAQPQTASKSSSSAQSGSSASKPAKKSGR